MILICDHNLVYQSGFEEWKAYRKEAVDLRRWQQAKGRRQKPGCTLTLASVAHLGEKLLQFGFGNDTRQCGISRGSHEPQPEQVGATEGPKLGSFQYLLPEIYQAVQYLLILNDGDLESPSKYLTLNYS